MKYEKRRWIATGKDHKMRTGKRPLAPESICDDKKCKFYGKPAAQGVCYTRIEYLASKYWDRVMRNGEELLKEMREIERKYRKGKNWKEAWIKRLEGQVVCTWANNTSTMDELINLRAENAKLRLALGKWKRR